VSNRNGLDLAFAPDLKSVLGFNWRLPFGGDLPFNVLFNTSYSYQSDINDDLDRNPLAAIATGYRSSHAI
jgi:hypothetical protein